MTILSGDRVKLFGQDEPEIVIDIYRSVTSGLRVLLLSESDLISDDEVEVHIENDDALISDDGE